MACSSWSSGFTNPSSCYSTVQGVSDIPVPTQAPICPDCQIGKKTKCNFPISLKCATASLQLVHCDLVEFPVESYYWHRYCLSIYDNYSGLGTCLLLCAKSDTSREFSEWVMWAENQTSLSLKKVRSNHGGEFLAETFCTFLQGKGVEHNLSVADHPQQNRRAERFNQTTLEREETLHHASCPPKNLWNFALQTAVHTYNRTPMHCIDWKTPIECFLGEKPDISYFHVFRCLAYVHIPTSANQPFCLTELTALGSPPSLCNSVPVCPSLPQFSPAPQVFQ